MRAARLAAALAWAIPVACALPSCGPSDNDPGPGGVTVGEARALDEAAEMIDQRRTPAEVLAGDETAADADAPEDTSEDGPENATEDSE